MHARKDAVKWLAGGRRHWRQRMAERWKGGAGQRGEGGIPKEMPGDTREEIPVLVEMGASEVPSELPQGVIRRPQERRRGRNKWLERQADSQEKPATKTCAKAQASVKVDTSAKAKRTSLAQASWSTS